MLKIGISVIVVIMLAGCLPIPAVYSSYYMPSYEDGKTRSPGCVGPKTKVFFQLPDNVDFEVRTDNALGNASVQYPIIIYFRIPRGVSFQFVDENINAAGSSPQSKVLIQNKLRVSSINHGAEPDRVFDFDKLCPVDAKTIEKNSQSINASLTYSVKLGEFLSGFPEKLELAFQPIVIDNKTVSFETISLDSKLINQKRHYYMPMFKKTFEECAIHQETKECKEYGRSLYLQQGFIVSNNIFSLTGKVRTYENDPFIHVTRNELNISFATPWRLPVPAVGIVDKSTGKTYFGNPEKKKMTFDCGSYTVPMTTPIHVTSNEAAEYSDVYIDGSIENLENKEITIFLPSVMINGKKIDFKPIKIHLKLLDAEILPFNC